MFLSEKERGISLVPAEIQFELKKHAGLYKWTYEQITNDHENVYDHSLPFVAFPL